MTARQPDVGGIAAAQLKSIVERYERLAEEADAIKQDQRDILAEAKSTGYDVKVLRKVIALRKRSLADVDEEATLTELYCRALGMLPAADDEPYRAPDIVSERAGTIITSEAAGIGPLNFDPDTGEIIEQSDAGYVGAGQSACAEDTGVTGGESAATEYQGKPAESPAYESRPRGADMRGSGVEAPVAIEAPPQEGERREIGRRHPPVTAKAPHPVLTPDSRISGEIVHPAALNDQTQGRTACSTAPIRPTQEPHSAETLSCSASAPSTCPSPARAAASAAEPPAARASASSIGAEYPALSAEIANAQRAQADLEVRTCVSSASDAAQEVTEAAQADIAQSGDHHDSASPVLRAISATAGEEGIKPASVTHQPADPYVPPALPEVMTGEPSPAELQIARKLGMKAFDEDIRMETIPVPDFRHPLITQHWRAGLQQAKYDHVEGGGKYWGNKNHPSYVEMIDGEPVDPVPALPQAVAPITTTSSAAAVSAPPISGNAALRMLVSTAPKREIVLPERKPLTAGQPVPKKRTVMSKAEIREFAARKNAEAKAKQEAEKAAKRAAREAKKAGAAPCA